MSNKKKKARKPKRKGLTSSFYNDEKPANWGRFEKKNGEKKSE